MRWPWHMRRNLNKRVAEARAEAEKSQQAYEETKQNVITPLQRNLKRNHFAELIRESLLSNGKNSV